MEEEEEVVEVVVEEEEGESERDLSRVRGWPAGGEAGE